MRAHVLDRGARCFRQGVGAEHRFIRIGRAYGWRITKSGFHDDALRHIDVTVVKAGERFSADIKARKRLSRGDRSVEDEWWWVERTSVNGKRGWLHGDADVIAFETVQGFVLLDRKRLLEWTDSVVDWTRTVGTPRLAHYRCYTRRGREDQVSLVKAEYARQAAERMEWIEPTPPPTPPPNVVTEKEEEKEEEDVLRVGCADPSDGCD